MEYLRLNLPFVANRIETIDFKKFCEGGSPEYISAKKKLKNLHILHQSFNPKDDRVLNTIILNEVNLISPTFKNGVAKNGESKVGPSNSSEWMTSIPINEKLRSISAYSLYINPLSFFDIHFVLAAGAVVVVAVIEKKLAENGIVGTAAALSGILRIALPVVAFGSVIYLISQLGILL